MMEVHNNNTKTVHQDSLWTILIDGCVMVKNVVIALLVAVYRFFISPPKKDVSGEIVVITGSGRGVGRQLSKRFGSLGAKVVLWDINEKDNAETARQIRDSDGICFTYTCDVSDRNEVYRVSEQVRKDVGEVSILINNAGVVTGRKLLDCPDEMVERTFNVNLLGQFWTVKSFLPSMMRRNHGHIVNMASSTGLVGLKNLTDYCASKFGVVGFTEVLNYEIVFSGYTGIYTTLVCPSFIKTGMFQGCRMRFPSLLPALEVEESVDRIMNAILTNQIMVCQPRSIYFFCFIKSLLPVDAMLDVIKFFGAASFMDNFIGRKDHGLKVAMETNHVTSCSELPLEHPKQNGGSLIDSKKAV